VKTVAVDGAELGILAARVDNLDPRGSWTFEIPLTGEHENAATVEVVEVAGY
jgi:hypothetical protein